MNDLKRDLAPITDEGWAEIEEEVRRTLGTCLAGRKLTDFEGPLGWDVDSRPTGRVVALEENLQEGVRAALRRPLPMIELEAAFELRREELDALERGAEDVDLDAVVDAARHLAAAEDRLVFDGLPAAGVRGMVAGSSHKAVPIASDYGDYPTTVARATESLRRAGIGGPYAIALGPRCYTGLAENAGPSGYPVIEHMKQLVSQVVWAPTLDGAIVVSMRGGDFRLTAGRDVSIRYVGHSDQTVRLALVESVTFRLLSPEAAVPLVYEG